MLHTCVKLFKIVILFWFFCTYIYTLCTITYVNMLKLTVYKTILKKNTANKMYYILHLFIRLFVWFVYLFIILTRKSVQNQYLMLILKKISTSSYQQNGIDCDLLQSKDEKQVQEYNSEVLIISARPMYRNSLPKILFLTQLLTVNF